LLNVIYRRISLVFIASSVVGTMFGISYRVGVSTALTDYLSVNGLLFTVFFASLSGLASFAYYPQERFVSFPIARCLGGLTFGLACTVLEPIVNRFSRAHPQLDVSPLFYFSVQILLCWAISAGIQWILARRRPYIDTSLAASHGG
jgi:hypothetical protein